MDLVMTRETMETGRAGAPASLPGAAEVGRAVLGFGLLGLCGALGSEGSATTVAPAALVVDVGALILTGPSLVVGHQALGLHASAPALAGALGRALSRSGEVALALCPALLWFAATSGLAPVVLGLFVAGVAAVGMAHAWVGLLAVERAAGLGGAGATLKDAAMQALILGWMGLTALVGLRLAAHLLGV